MGRWSQAGRLGAKCIHLFEPHQRPCPQRRSLWGAEGEEGHAEERRAAERGQLGGKGVGVHEQVLLGDEDHPSMRILGVVYCFEFATHTSASRMSRSWGGVHRNSLIWCTFQRPQLFHSCFTGGIFTILLRGYSQAGNMHRARALLDEMVPLHLLRLSLYFFFGWFLRQTYKGTPKWMVDNTAWPVALWPFFFVTYVWRWKVYGLYTPFCRQPTEKNGKRN